MIPLLGLGPGELQRELEPWVDRAFRARQVFEAIYEQDLSKLNRLRLVLAEKNQAIARIQRQIDEGKPPMEAASLGIKKVGSAVIAGSASVLAVFTPIAFMEGIVGRFFFQYRLDFSTLFDTVCNIFAVVFHAKLMLTIVIEFQIIF